MEFKDRKHPRLKNYDYSQPGYYYITIHTAGAEIRLSSVGRGVAERSEPSNKWLPVATTPQFIAPAEAAVRLTPLGKIAREQLLALQARYPYVKIDKFVIMPTHIHAIIVLEPGAMPRPTLMDIVRAYKSLTTRACNEIFATAGRKLFQTSFYESVLRNEQAYRECWQYIEDNPAKWLLNPEDL